MPPSPLPARIDRAALERIIKRAAELQAGSRDIGDVLTPDEVIRLGTEVGIPQGYLQQALLEETSRVDLGGGEGFWDRAIGPGQVSAQRVVRGTLEEIQDGLLRWMEENELLTITRQQSGRLAWEPLRGFQAAMRRSAAALGGGRKPFMLARTDAVNATIVPLEPGYCNVLLTASVRKERGSFIGGAAAASLAGVAAGAALAVMSPFLLIAVAPLPFGFGIAWGIGRRYRPVAARVQMGLERPLDHLERGVVKPSHQLPEKTGIMGLIAEEVKKALK